MTPFMQMRKPQVTDREQEPRPHLIRNALPDLAILLLGPA